MPSVAPCPVVPIIVTADSCVAITERPTAHQGRLRFARKYPSISFVPLDRRRPWITTYVSHPTTITQFSQCIGRMRDGRRGVWSRRELLLHDPEDDEGDHLHGHHAEERDAKTSRGCLARHRRR